MNNESAPNLAPAVSCPGQPPIPAPYPPAAPYPPKAPMDPAKKKRIILIYPDVSEKANKNTLGLLPFIKQ